MVEGELIIVSIVMLISTLLSIQLFQKGWEKRQKIKYQYQLKRAKLSKKVNAPVKEEPSVIGTIGNLAPLLKNLDGDQLTALVDRFLGEGFDIPSTGGEGGITDLIMDIAAKNPDIVQGFLQGISKKTDQKPPDQESY